MKKAQKKPKLALKDLEVESFLTSVNKSKISTGILQRTLICGSAGPACTWNAGCSNGTGWQGACCA